MSAKADRSAISSSRGNRGTRSGRAPGMCHRSAGNRLRFRREQSEPTEPLAVCVVTPGALRRGDRACGVSLLGTSSSAIVRTSRSRSRLWLQRLTDQPSPEEPCADWTIDFGARDFLSQRKSRSATSAVLRFVRSAPARRLAVLARRQPFRSALLAAVSSGRSRAMSNFRGTGKPSSACAVSRADMFCGMRTMGGCQSNFTRGSVVAQRRVDQLGEAVHFSDENRLVRVFC